ncbi:MAG: hypothetical protein Q8K78_12845 [Planctomycetaceae bacterium]|nr:hypothetical protein [Planctomycetaceae bacterium]
MKRAADIKLKIDGTGVTPATLSLDDLLFIVEHYRNAIVAFAGDAGRLEAGEVIALMGVEKGSATPVVRAPERFRTLAYSLTESLHSKTFHQHPAPAHRILAEISKRCQQRGIFVRLPGTRGKHFDIGAGHPFEVPPPPTFIESTVLYGSVRSAGGAMPHAEIVTDNGRVVSVLADQALIIELAKCLYQTVGLEGDGTYDAETHQLKAFRALRRTEFEETDLLAAFEELAAVSEGVWDGIDPVEYVQALRDDE